MPQPLKDFIEIDNSAYGQLKSLLGAMNLDVAKPWLDEVKQSSYELGQATTLAMVMREIEELPVFQGETDFEDGGDSEYADRRMAVDAARTNGQHEMKQSILSTLKQKLSGNGE